MMAWKLRKLDQLGTVGRGKSVIGQEMRLNYMEGIIHFSRLEMSKQLNSI